MSYTDRKITQAEINAHHVQGATDYLIGNPQQNKAVFDNLPEFIAGKFNDLIDEIAGQHGDEIKVAVDEWLAEHPEVTTTVQDNSLTTAKYVDGSVTEPKIAEGAVTPSKLDRAYSTPDDLASVNANLTNELNVLDARMDEFASLPEGSTTADAELLDIRAGADGITYPTAGGAVRGQVADLKSDHKNIVDTLVDGDIYNEYLRDSYKQGVVHNGNYSNPDPSDTTTVYGRLFPINSEKELHVDVASGYKVLIVYYANDGSSPVVVSWLTGNNIILPSAMPSGKTKFCIEVRTSSTSAITPSDASDKVNVYYVYDFDYYNKEESDNNVLPIKQYLGMASPTSEVELDYKIVDSRRIKSDGIDDEHSTAFIESITVSAVSGFLTSIGVWDGTIGSGSSTAWADGSSYHNDNSFPYFLIQAKKMDNSIVTVEEYNNFVSNVHVTVTRKVLKTENNNVVYVSTSGSDSNDGTSTHPFATIQKAVDSGAAKIIVAPGTYIGSVNIFNRTNLSIEVSDYGTNASISEKPKIVLNATGETYGIYCMNVCELAIRDIEVYGANTALIYGVNIRNMKCENVVVHDNVLTNFLYSGIQLVNVTGRFVNCLAYNIDRDGFNIHGIGHTEFIDCVAHDCRDDGISHHELCTGVIRGGEYYNCGKGGISSPYDRSSVNIDNVFTHDNVQWGIMGGSISDGVCHGNITNCVCKRNGNKDIKVYGSNSKLYGWNNIYDTKEIDDPSTFIEF